MVSLGNRVGLLEVVVGSRWLAIGGWRLAVGCRQVVQA